MLEKEIKILEINVDDVMQKIEALGGIKTFEGFIHDEYFDFSGNKMDENDRIFRVRKKGETHLYTIKRKRKKSEDGGIEGLRIADEIEVSITDVASFKRVLDTYGMEKIREKKKYRIAYLLDAIVFDIDVYDNIPPLLEIEGKTIEEIHDYVAKLGLTKNTIKTFGSRGLYKYYGIEYNYV